jgi:SNF2 family DNA or RNA helicase
LYLEGNKNWEEIHDGKISALGSILEECGNVPILVAYHFKHDLERLKSAFPQGKVLENDAATEAAWNRGEIPLLFIHPASAGHGLNLQDGGNILVFFSIDWRMEEHIQVIERIGPMRQKQSGHDRNVFLHYILAEGTIDEDIYNRIVSKRSVQDILLDAMSRFKDRGIS